jgi:N-sulfoglucosamine sulfohydrolase
MSHAPNIVLIVADDHGREAVGCYGNPVARTPNLDALAAGGVRFTNAFCTTASCAASRATILTGLQNHATGTYGHTHGVHHFACFDRIRTLPALLRAGGVRTGRLGKRHYAPESLFPFDWERPQHAFGRDDVAMAEAAREFVRGREPFFLHWCSMNPHRAAVLESHPLRPDTFGNPAAAFPGDAEQPFDESAVIVPPFLPDTPAVRAELAQYYQSIARLDRGVGRLLRVLAEEGRLDNSVVLYVSDNGAAFPQAKTTLYDPGMRLPLIVRSPLHRGRGTTCDGLVTWADLTPTILELAGVAFDSAAFHGRSFAGIVDQPSPADWREEIYAAHTFHEITNYYPMRVVRTKRHKFIYNIAWKLDYSSAADLWRSASWQAALAAGNARFGCRTMEAYLHRPRFELYDLEADPNETVNLADDPRHAALVQAFADKVRRFQEQTQDPWLHKWTYE